MQTNTQPYTSARKPYPTFLKVAISLMVEFNCSPTLITGCPVKKRKPASPPVFPTKKRLSKHIVVNMELPF